MGNSNNNLVGEYVPPEYYTRIKYVKFIKKIKIVDMIIYYDYDWLNLWYVNYNNFNNSSQIDNWIMSYSAGVCISEEKLYRIVMTNYIFKWYSNSKST